MDKDSEDPTTAAGKSSASVDGGGGPNCTFTFKKSIRRAQNTRGRQPEKQKDDSSASDSSSDSDTKIVKVQKKARRSNPMVQKTGSGGSRQFRNRNKSSSEDADDDEDGDVKRKDKSSVSVFYESSKTSDRVGPADMGATAIVETETEKDRDAQTLFEKSLEINKELKEKEADDGVYRGLNNYTRFIDKRDTAAGNAASGSNRKGPIRAPDNIRVTVRWDYQPDICKDYKETGYCGFGDSCKFLHDRSDYKFGWQIEREMNEGRYGRDDETAGKYEIPDDEEQLPFKCLLCRESFVNPVMTKCKHYFCEKCALSHYRKSQRCFVCDAQTHGVFNPAKEIIARLKNEEAAAGTSSSSKHKHSGMVAAAPGVDDDDDESD